MKLFLMCLPTGVKKIEAEGFLFPIAASGYERKRLAKAWLYN